MFSAATTCTTRAPFVGSPGLLPQPAINPTSGRSNTKTRNGFHYGDRNRDRLRTWWKRGRAAALGAKTDVKGRAKERVHEIKENVSAKTPSSASSAASSAGTTVKRNPVPTTAIAALLAGFAIGWLVASRRYG